ncbi:MAG: cysteine desulfurase [Bdellovibrionales bacterium]|nr:cysteine desulfurase [Bdellovibrionales bacterium]
MKVYLDNNATTPVDPRVVDAMLPVFREHYGNPSSKSHSFGWIAEELVSISREQVASCIGCDPDEVIFTSGATEATNLALRGLSSRKKIRLLSTPIEHKATLDCISLLKDQGHFVELVSVDSLGRINIPKLESALHAKPAILTYIGAHNEIGTIQDNAKITELAHAHETVVHADLSQALGKMIVNVKEIGVDLASFSGHKVYGPKGVGVLFVKRSLQSILKPLIVGGGQEMGLRSGTLNVPGIVGFGKACEIAVQEHHQIDTHVSGLTRQFIELIRTQVPNVTIQGDQSNRITGNLNIRLPGSDSSRILGALASTVAISAGSACLSASKQSSHVLSAIGLSETASRECIRVGIGRFNTEEEINFAVAKLTEAIESLQS